MPANLPPGYHEAEQRFREARSTGEKIEALDEMLAIVPKHKGTDKLRAMLRRRKARLLDEEQKQGGGRRGHDPYLVRREGAGQVALYGLPNSGKSSLVKGLTNASCAVADYPFTTRSPVPGMMDFEDVKVQLVDLPPLMDDAARPWLPRVLGRADSLAIIVDAGEEAGLQVELLGQGLSEMGLAIPWREGGRGFICLSRCDLAGQEADAVRELATLGLAVVAVSVTTRRGLDDFRREAFASLGVIRVYTKTPHEKPRMSDPIVLPGGSVVEEAARALHKDFASSLRFARVWGEGFYDGQKVARDQVLSDGLVVEFHL